MLCYGMYIAPTVKIAERACPKKEEIEGLV